MANFALLPAALAATELVASWGTDRVAAHARTLTDRAAAGALALGLAVAPPALRHRTSSASGWTRRWTPRRWRPAWPTRACTSPVDARWEARGGRYAVHGVHNVMGSGLTFVRFSRCMANAEAAQGNPSGRERGFKLGGMGAHDAGAGVGVGIQGDPHTGRP